MHIEKLFSAYKGRLLTGFRGGQILSLTLIYDLETSRTMLNSMANGFERNIFGAEVALQRKIKVEKKFWESTRAKNLIFFDQNIDHICEEKFALINSEFFWPRFLKNCFKIFLWLRPSWIGKTWIQEELKRTLN